MREKKRKGKRKKKDMLATRRQDLYLYFSKDSMVLDMPIGITRRG